MDAAAPNSPVPAPPPPRRPDVLNAWPPSAQWATAFLLGVCLALLVVQCLTYLRWGTRPTELQGGRAIAYPVDLNRARRADLQQLPGIGEVLAQRIEKHRLDHGPFRSVDELRQVPGIGPAKLEQLRPWVRVTAPAPDRENPHRPPPREQMVAVNLPAFLDGMNSRRQVSKKEQNLKEVINVNSASMEELQRLPGIGPRLSQRIVEERSKRPFQTVDDLRRVAGIGPKILERLRPHITAGGDPGRVARAGG